MAAWIPADWLHAGIPWGKRFRLIGGTYVSREIRLVRPVVDAGTPDTWVADHFGRQAQVAVTFASGHFDDKGSRLDVSAAASAAEAERFARQAQVSASLADPHLVQVFETGSAKGVPFMVTELLEGKSLRERLQEGALSLADALTVVQQMAGLLAKAHAHKIQHGDLRPDHLFLLQGRREPFVKVSRFAAGERLRAAVVPGSRAPQPAPTEEPSSLLDQAYASPERLLRGSGNDAQSDLWALAVTMYELLTTILPFEAPTPAGVAVAICAGEFSQPSHYRADLPSTIDAWFARALARQPGDRFQNPLELAHAFSQALDGPGPEPRASSEKTSSEKTSSDRGSWSDVEDDDDDDDDEEERTVKWDLPSDWSLSVSSSPVADSLAPSTPPPLPNRMPSSRPPPSGPAFSPALSVATVSPGTISSPATLPPLARPGTFFTGDLARVARLPPAPGTFTAAATPVFTGQRTASPRPRRFGVLYQGLLFGAALGAISALSLWIMHSLSSSGDDAADSTELALEPSWDDEGNPIAAGKASPRRAPDPKELPRIIQTDDLPHAPDDPEDEDLAPEVPRPAITTSTVKPPARTTAAPAKAKAPTTEPPVVKGRVPFSLPPRPAARHGTASKQAKAGSNCNPPYFFDSNNIRRLKLECL